MVQQGAPQTTATLVTSPPTVAAATPQPGNPFGSANFVRFDCRTLVLPLLGVDL